MMLSSEFPINYFSVSEVEQDWPDEFQVRHSLLMETLHATVRAYCCQLHMTQHICLRSYGVWAFDAGNV
jgi:hypothetical protein